MMRIAINPNLRLGPEQYTHADPLPDSIPSLGEAVEVYEPVSGMVGTATIQEIDAHDNSVVLKVDWGSLKVPE